MKYDSDDSLSSEEIKTKKNSEETDSNKNTEGVEANTSKKSKKHKKHKKNRNKKQNEEITNSDKKESPEANKEGNTNENIEKKITENENKETKEKEEKEENKDEKEDKEEKNTNENIVQSSKKRKKRNNKRNKKKKKEGKINNNDNYNDNDDNATEETNENKKENNNETKEENLENISNNENKEQIKEEKKEEKEINKGEQKEEEEEKEEKEEKPKVSKIIEEDSKMLLYINPISKYLISFFQSHSLDEYLGLNTKYGLVGLENLGNTCYMNSALQCLSNCEYLTKYFLCNYYKREINTESKYSCQGEIAISYASLLDKLWRQTHPYIRPISFLKTFISHVSSFSYGSQHDSHEMLIYLLEKLHEDLNRNKEKKYVELNEKQENETDIEASNRWWETHLKRDNSIIMDLFSGQYKSTLKCPFCDKISITYDQFSCLELPLENNYFFGTSYVVNEKENKIRKINLIFGESEKFKEICDKINCQKSYKAILCRSSKMYLACLKDDHNLYELISQSHLRKSETKDRIIFYEYEKNELNDKLLFFVIPVVNSKSFNKISDQEEEYYHLFFPKIFYYTPDQKIQKFYDDLKKYYYKYYKEKDSNFSDDKIKLRIVNNLTACTKNHDPCDYCKSKTCISCEFKFGKNMTMGELKATQSKTRSFVMYLDIPKENFKNNDFESIKLYDNYLNDEEDFILNNELTLEKCFNSFSKCEKLDESNEWYCSKCKKHRRGYKQLEIFRLPRYLILQLKRFKNQFGFFSNSKNSALVDFPLEGLNLNKYLVGPRNNDYIYDLISVSQHHGLSFGGHYTSVCKKENIWYKFDDEDVERIDKKRIVDSSAYILIYKLRE